MNHRQAWELIPWLVNGTLAEAQRAQLQHHVETCAQCRQELHAQGRLQQAMQSAPQVERMPHAGLQQLRERLDAQPAAPPRSPADEPRRHAIRWLAAAVVAQGLLVGVLAYRQFWPPGATTDDAAYRTVTAPASAATPASVRAVFSPDMTLGELQALLERARLRIVDGPSPEGVYTLAATAAGLDSRQALLTLRAHPAARFAEPITR